MEPLASRAVPIAAGMGHEVVVSAADTLVLMTTQRGGAAGGDGPKHFPMMGRQTVGFREVGQCGSHHLAQGDSTGTTGPDLLRHRTRRDGG